ncbi:TonB-dependent siderophore receptor [Zavarzinia compransoris]|uniref:TonB-dependent siderophore receptor n=1 Tax=Zavarzinia compransoris TaxID=1264899 RepID=A0A317E5N3_9PROT|nr:TonB-dependent siderophore receptor [Zavarzinia compransoris]PWR21664.1 TonB-dependent siderophore receptor [Zavarzinia compransoris]
MATALAAGVLAAGTLGGGPAFSQQGPATAERRIAFDIPAQDLAAALRAYAGKAGIQVVYDPSRLAGAGSGGVQGTFTARDALARLLAGTGVSFRFTGPATAVIEGGGPAAAAPAGSELLPVVTVEGAGRPVDGYIASRTTTATRTDTPLIDVPQSVTVVSQELIRDQAMQSMEDAVRYIPGVGMAQGEGNRDTPILRGNASTADFFVDGIRDDVQYFRDFYNIDRLEALKGPNAMIFGRGGGGGVLNRVTRQADWTRTREVTVQAGSFENMRTTFDIGDVINDDVAFRVTAMYENTEGYRDFYEQERYAVNPTVALRPTDGLTITLGYEHFRDERTADRGITSFRGRPVDTDPSTFFGNPDLSPTWAEVNAFNALIDYDFGGGVTLRNRTRYAVYDKFYQNVFAGAPNAAGTTVGISAYNNMSTRENLFNQTDLNFKFETGSISHDFLVGGELGRQETTNFRETGFFPGGGTTLTVPLSNPTTFVPIRFAQNASDVDNRSVANVAALYVQDQIGLTSQVQLVLGLRYDRFEADVHNNRNGADFSGADDLLSPRAGLVYKPVEDLSLYASYSVSYLPRAGEQLASLNASNSALDPEEYKNYEVGAKWDVNPNLSLTAAIYQLDRTNVAITDPADPTKLILVDGQRTKGFELGVSGYVLPDWSIMGGYAYQDGELTSNQSASARDGAVLGQLPKHSISLWNKYDITPEWGVGLGVIHRSSMFTSTSNTVELPGYTRVDAALYWTLNENLRAQLNVENVFDTEYYANAHSDTNIMPGSPRSALVGLTARF